MANLTRLTEKEIKNKFENLRYHSSTNFPQNGKFTKQWLKNTLLKIDSLWYKGCLFPLLTKIYGGTKLRFFSKEKDAGYITEDFQDKQISLHINRKMFMQLFLNGDQSYHVGGLICTDRLSCLLHVLLHETAHLLITVCDTLKYIKEKQHHGKIFARFTCFNFGHVDISNGLISKLNPNMNLITLRKNLFVGQKVTAFINRSHENVIILQIRGKTASVRLLKSRKQYTVHIGLLKIKP